MGDVPLEQLADQPHRMYWLVHDSAQGTATLHEEHPDLQPTEGVSKLIFVGEDASLLWWSNRGENYLGDATVGERFDAVGEIVRAALPEGCNMNDVCEPRYRHIRKRRST